jgi:AraC-like DNA-binding protein
MTTIQPLLFEEFRYRALSPLQIFLPSTLYHIFYIHEGTLDRPTGEIRSTSPSGELIIRNSGTRHDIYAESGEAQLHTYVAFLPGRIKSLETQTNGIDLLLPFEVLGQVRIRLHAEAVLECDDALSRINRFHRQLDWVQYNRLVMAFLDLLIIIYAQCEPRMKETKYSVTDKERNVRKITAFIENAFNQDMTLDLMERELHLSKQYMSKIFREHTGLTIFEYLYRRRINEAKQRIQEQHNCSITDICFQVGFNSVSHFSTLFKTHVGLSPERYRKSLAALDN